MDINEWKNKNNTSKKYAHFDKRVSLSTVWNYITNPEKVASHNFYPFIHYKKTFKKYSKNSIKIKERELCYSAHIDRCIYLYYGYQLNEVYNQRVINDQINFSAIAYRNNLVCQNNISFAKRAFDFIKKSENCYIIVGDFTNFFDMIDHKYLKLRLIDLLGGSLHNDYYAVYKNITRYSTWDLVDILKLNNLKDTMTDRKLLNKKEQVLTLNEFKKNKKQYIKPNQKNYGIPQGSAISAVLSNIYMLAVDKEINNYVKGLNGLYMRYSDDFIIIIPKSNKEAFKYHLEFIRNQINTIPNLILQPEKTQIYTFKNETLLNSTQEFIPNVRDNINVLNYLGFTFDGKTVSIRAKTISKYYYRMYRKLKSIVRNNGVTKKGNRISCKNLYLKYSYKGANVGNGNFLTYVQHCKSIFGENESIDCDTKRHMQKIRKKLNKINWNFVAI